MKATDEELIAIIIDLWQRRCMLGRRLSRSGDCITI